MVGCMVSVSARCLLLATLSTSRVVVAESIDAHNEKPHADATARCDARSDLSDASCQTEEKDGESSIVQVSLLQHRLRPQNTKLASSGDSVDPAANIEPPDYSNYTFEDYITEFHKNYTVGTPEYINRKKGFEDAMADVVRHNADTNQTYTKGINKFSDWTKDEFKLILGYVKAAQNQRGGRKAKAATVTNATQPPKEFSWVGKGVLTAVKNQGHCGSCWAFATTEAVESHAAINSGYVLEELSPQQLTSCAPNPLHCGGTGGCGGSIAEAAMDYIVESGMTTEWEYPYTSYWGSTGECNYDYKHRINMKRQVVTITGYKKLPENHYWPVLQALVEVGPLIVNVQAAPWVDYTGGVADPCTDGGNINIDHVVQLVGYGTDPVQKLDYWLVRNSWEATWGEKGYIRLKRTPPDDTTGMVKCGIDSAPLDGTACEFPANNTPVPIQQTVCGTCGILFDVSYPTGAKVR